jgi:CRISPR-associated protein Cmr4
VDLSIVRDPATRVPKIPGSSLAGVCRAYAAMEYGKYPECAGQGQAASNGTGGHCGSADCRICTVFGFAKGGQGGFADLAAFSDAHILLFPVATREGPVWLTCPAALRLAGMETGVSDNVLYRSRDSQPLNLGWLLLPVDQFNEWNKAQQAIQNMAAPAYITGRMGILSDKLFSHVVNSNLETRTSVSIDPATGAAAEGALFTYEALPRSTTLLWDVTCRNLAHFKVGGSQTTSVKTFDDVFAVVSATHAYVEHLGIGGMGTRGMGRLRVLSKSNSATPATSQSGGK